MKDMDIDFGGDGEIGRPGVVFDIEAGTARLANERKRLAAILARATPCLLYTSPSPRDS